MEYDVPYWLQALLARIILDFGPLRMNGSDQITRMEAARAALVAA